MLRTRYNFDYKDCMKFGITNFLPRMINNFKRQFHLYRRGDWWFYRLQVKIYGR